MKVKIQTILISLLGILVFGLILCTNQVEAVSENSLDKVPDTIEVPNLKTFEDKSIFPSKEIENIIKSYVTEDLTNCDLNVNFSYCSNIGLRDISKLDIELENKENQVVAKKTISINYTDTKWNNTDKQYVENKLKNVDLYLKNIEVNIDDAKIDNADEFINNKYIELLKDLNIECKFYFLIGDWSWPDIFNIGGQLALGKNGIVYYIYDALDSKRIVGQPIIKVPADIKETEEAYIDYAIDKIKKYYKEEYSDIYEESDVITIKKGNKENEYIMHYSRWSEDCSFIMKKEEVKEVTSTDTKTNIKLETTTGVVPTDTKLVVEKITTGETYNTVVATLGADVDKFVLYDISLTSNNVKIQPNGKVKLAIPIPEGFDKTKLLVYRVAEDGTKTKLDVVVDNNNAIIETDYFSSYVLGEKASIEDNKENNIEETKPSDSKLDETPKTGNNNSTIIVLSIVIVISLAGIIILNRKK